MPIRVLRKQWITDEDFEWKFVCIVYDNEQLGFIERLLSSANWEVKVQRQDSKPTE